MIIGELCSDFTFKKRYNYQKILYNRLASKFGGFVFINCYKIFNKKKIKIDIEFFKKKNIYFFTPSSMDELNSYFLKNKFFLINNLSYKFEHLKFHLAASRKNIFQISFDNTAIFFNYKLENWDHVNFRNKISFLFRKRFSKIVYKLLISLNIIKQIDIYYQVRRDTLIRYKKNKSILLKYFFKKILPVNLKFSSINHKITNKYITFVDSNILHEDSIRRGYIIDNISLKLYFLNLRKYLIQINKVTKKKIVIALHPSSDERLYKFHLKGFIFKKYKTEYYIANSDIVLFHSSSSIFEAIILKKKIINLKSKILGGYVNSRRKHYLKKVELTEHDIDKQLKFDKKRLYAELSQKVKYYDKFLRSFYIFTENSRSIENILEKKILLLNSKKNNF